MANITSRKGLAFGALVGLGTSLIAGVPAHAAGANVVLAPSAGTSYTMVAGGSLELTATASSEIPSSSWNTMKFKVTNVDGYDAIAWQDFNGPGNFGGFDWDSLNGDAGSSVVLEANYEDVNNQIVTLTSYDSDHTSHYTVTAWLDANDNGTVDSTEYSQTQTVTFAKASELTVTTTVGAVASSNIYTDDSLAKATVKLGNFNNEQGDWYWNNVHNQVTVKFKDGVNNVWDWTKAEYNSTTGEYTAYAYLDPNNSAGTLVSAQAYFDSYNNTDVWYECLSDNYWGGCVDAYYVYNDSSDDIAIGTAAVKAIKAHAVDSLDWSMDATSTSKTNGDVATNEEHKVVLTATDADGKIVANQAVKVWMWTDNYALADGVHHLTVNGVTYKSDATLPGDGADPLSLVTDAKGQVVLTVKGTLLEDGYVTGFYAEAENMVWSDNYYTTERDRSYTAYITNSEFRVYDAQAGATTAVNATVTDQFGKLLPDGYNAVVYLDGGSRSDTGATTGAKTFAPVTAGKTAFNVVDDGKGTGFEVLYFEVMKKDATTGSYTGDPVATTWFSIEYNDAADSVPANIELWSDWYYNDAGVATPWGYGAEGDEAGLTTADFGTFDSRFDIGTAPEVKEWPASGWTGLYFGGGVVSASTPTHTGIGVANAKVTITGAGLQFRTINDDGYKVYTVGSATTYTNYGGYFGLVVWSHKTGKNTFSVTVGSVTKNFEFYVDYPAADSGVSLTIDAPDWTMPGKSFQMTASLKDKFGNLVPTCGVNVDVSGIIAFVDNWNTCTWYWDDTMFHYWDTLGANESGAITWKLTYTNGAGDTITASKTMLVQNGAIVPADAKVTVSAPASSQNGRAVDVKVTVTTAAGVAIPGAEVSLAGLGVGYLGTTSATTDANGVVTVKLIAGGDEIGDANITATAGSVKGTAKVSFGITDANLNIAGKRVTADWSFAAGKRVVIYRDGVQIRNFVASSDASDSFSFNLKKGKHVIKIKVGGVTIDSQTYNVK